MRQLHKNSLVNPLLTKDSIESAKGSFDVLIPVVVPAGIEIVEPLCDSLVKASCAQLGELKNVNNNKKTKIVLIFL